MEACVFDNGDCESLEDCAVGCSVDLIGNDWCDIQCAVKECSFDGGDCDS